MDFEEQQVLQEKISRSLGARVGDAARGLRASSEELARQVEALADELGRKVEEGAAEAAAEVAVELAEAKAGARGAVEMVGTLARGVKSVLEQTDQLAVLETLLAEALRVTDGAAIFVLKDENLGGWRAGGRIDGRRIRGVHFPLAERNSLARALRDREPVSAAGAYAEGDRSLFAGLELAPPDGIVAVPLVIRENAQAVLFGARFKDAGVAAGETVLEVLAALGAAAVSAIFNIQGRARGTDDEPPRPSAARDREAPSPGPEEPARPPAPVPHPEPEPRPKPEPETLRSPAAPAEPVVPPASASPAEPADKPRSPWFTPAARTSSFGARDMADLRRDDFEVPSDDEEGPTEEVPLTPEEQELHDDARRFARLLVSEIKLYNEEKVVEGRRERDLYQRLRTDIERSRQMYNERVPPSIAARTNYFMDELVSILAEGDRSALGM